MSIFSLALLLLLSVNPGMLTRPAGHEAKAEADAQNFVEAETTMYEAEARHVKEQLSV